MIARVKAFFWFIGFCAFVLPILSKCGAQTETVPTVRFGIVSPEVREFLAREWDLHAKDDPYLERGYCGYIEPGIFAGESAWIVTRITPPDTIIGTPTRTGINFRCFDVWSVPIHVHPPQSCETKTSPCYEEGLYAFQCLASDNDRYMLTRYVYPFGVVQCERRALITFWPIGVAGA